MPRRRDPGPAPRSGIVLAGGRSSRIGAPKALLEVAGAPLLRRVASALVPSCDELIVVTAPASAQPPAFADALARECRTIAHRWRALSGGAVRPALRPRVRVVEDAAPHLGPVAGLARGLAAARGEVAFVSACDLPFLHPALVASFLDLAERERADAVLARCRGHLEPLAGAYRVATMAALYAVQLAERELKPTSRLDRVRLREVGERALARLDPGGRSFVNVNAHDDLEAARALAEVAAPTARGSRPARSRRGSSAGG